MSKRLRSFALAIAVLMTVFATIPTYALHPVQARDLSMGMASAADAIGVRVVGYNPAFLAFSNQPNVTVSVPALNFGFRFGNNSFSMDDLNTYFADGDTLTATEADELVDLVESDALKLTTDTFVRVLGVSFPAKYLDVALTYDVGVSFDTRLDDDFIDIIFRGNSFDQLGIPRTFDQTKTSMFAASRVGLTFAKSFQYADEFDWMDELTAGATFNYYMGHAFVDIEESDGSFLADYGGTELDAYFEVIGAGMLETDSEDTLAAFYGQDDPMAGSGVGLDLGVGAVLLDGKARVGVSIINLVNTMNWTGGVRHIYALRANSIPLDGLTGGEDYIDENFTQIDSSVSRNEDLTTELPRQFRLDGAYQVRNDLVVTGGLVIQTNDVIGADGFVRAGVGAEYSPLKVLPLRAGISVGGRSGVSLGGGFGLHFGWWHTDIGFGWEHGVANGAKGLRIGFNNILVFGTPKPAMSD